MEIRVRTHRGIVRMIGGHGSGGFGGQFIKLAGGDALVNAGTDLLGHENRVTVVAAKAITKLLQTGGDLVKMHCLLTPISLHHIHLYKKNLTKEFRRTGPVQRQG